MAQMNEGTPDLHHDPVPKGETVNVEERLERLTEKHEALTQSVELLQLEREDQNRRIGKLVGLMESFAEIVQVHERLLKELKGGNR